MRSNLSPEEKARRKDLTRPGVAQEALDLVAELEAEGRSPSEAFTDPDNGGYSLTRVVMPAVAEEQRIRQELARRPSKDVTSDMLDVAAVKARHGIPEFTPPGRA